MNIPFAMSTSALVLMSLIPGSRGTGCVCPLRLNPVCGLDGLTHQNEDCLNCKFIKMDYRGPCKGDKNYNMLISPGKKWIKVVYPTNEQIGMNDVNQIAMPNPQMYGYGDQKKRGKTPGGYRPWW